MTSLDVTCSDPTCTNNPNSGIDADGKCHCCATDGTAYWDSTSKTCKPCDGSTCGGNGGYCRGTDADCGQDSSTKKWRQTKSPMQPTCNCGWSEYLTFSKCQDGKCSFSLSQWKTWLLYLTIFIGFILIVLLIVAVARPTVKVTLPVEGTSPVHPGYVAMR